MTTIDFEKHDQEEQVLNQSNLILIRSQRRSKSPVIGDYTKLQRLIVIFWTVSHLALALIRPISKRIETLLIKIFTKDMLYL